jgi:hypothetical protein
MGLTPIKASDVAEGDMIDLEHVPEPYVRDEDREHVYQYEYAVVVGVERETADCIRVDFDTTSIGFPLDFELMMVPGDPR